MSPGIDVRTLRDDQHNLQVVDVRYPNEWNAGHIDGSVHIPVDELADRLDKLDRSLPVVTVCRSGNRSSGAARVLSGAGFDAESLDGGLLAWADEGLPLTDSGGQPGTVTGPDSPSDRGSAEHQELQSDYIRLALEVQEQFGDREPSEQEVQAYLRDRLIREGRSPEEADETMARVAAAGGDDAP
ncbi:MAG: rhodanese-like domain-containing protein [Actinomycetota bacterium]|nr:rhodanese-like domain-containing protein [Actinomycetota bacterium]